MNVRKMLTDALYAICFVLAIGALVRQFTLYKTTVICASTFEEVKKIAITFDDGPHPIYTPMLLDALKERGIVATFFVTGENAQNYPDIIRRMYEDGHLIGNHTYSHIQLTSSNREKFRKELVTTNEVIYEITGLDVSFVRPPYGTWEKELETELSMFPVLWDIDTLDWCSDNPSIIASRVFKDISENDIILMHDCYLTTVDATIIVADELNGRGYEFVTVDKLMFD